MSILCAKLTVDINNIGNKTFYFESMDLKTDFTEDLCNLLKYETPAVYVVNKFYAKNLSSMESTFEYLGVKNSAISLTTYLMRSDKNRIPVLTGNYSEYDKVQETVEQSEKFSSGNKVKIGKVLSSIKTFIENWSDKKVGTNTYNAFIIGIEEKQLEEIILNKEVLKSYEFRDRIHIVDEINENSLSENGNGITMNSDNLSKELIGKSKAMDRVREQLLKAAKHKENVLVGGETGTGKSLAAKLIHNYSKRNVNKFVTVNCCSMTETLFESELYGYVRGAFTGAVKDRKGLWQQAQGGTLFFDEIGELPLSQQAKILLAIENNVIRPVGSDKEIPVNARLIFATRRDLAAMVQNGTFREDLYWRIRCVTILMPPLRDQIDSIRYLAQTLWEQIKEKPEDPMLPNEILDKLEKINWTGNTRSLKMVLKSLYCLNIEKHPKDLEDLEEALGDMQIQPEETLTKHSPSPLQNLTDDYSVDFLQTIDNAEEWLTNTRQIHIIDKNQHIMISTDTNSSFNFTFRNL